ncbi:DUF975 family protein [Lachnoclostridium sp. An118]|uniref:DUF975 family protein n=1 Tax=Lachnoclostridium sp. An118 TaxID=1965547 RepID=UPI000B3A1682|nr:DUF975 family protein [Lachnoclostridium sp. An118]OUQ52655.1 hypothetical protein B5E62_01040 [Lachnoclostridium sp. An118]
MPTRKEMKRKARRALKRHYIMYVAICLIAAYVGSEFTSSLNVLDVTPASGSYHTEERLERPSGINEGFADVMYDMLAGDEEDGKALSDELKAEEIERSRTGNPAFGRSRGVLASLVNSVTSGSIVVSMLAALHSLTGSENLAILIFILLGAAFLFSIWFFFVNIFKVISRRVFLEGRVYEKVPFQRMLFLLRVKKWTKVSCTMFLASLYQLLWSLTIVGGFVKYFSYYLVPYIAAENPDIAPGEAIRLSRRMMKGHKWECFVFEMSFFPWLLLGGATFGISEILYSNPYRAAFFSEYYADMRAEAKKAHLKGSELLNDTYLYEMPEDELIYLAYEDVISALIRRPKDILKLSGVRKFFADQLGVLLTNSKTEKEYEQMQGRLVKMELLKDAVDRKAYPSRLSAVPEVEKRQRIETIHYLRHYSIWSIVLLFFIFSAIGWVWEVSLHLVTDGEFVNRGVLHGPWLPIYGGGGVLILMLLNRLRKRPVLEFIGIVVLCGCVEYTTSFVLEILHNGERWWDYSGYFLNLNGRICAEGLLVFGIGGIAIVYMLAPLLDNQIQRIRPWVLIPLCLILLTAFTVDNVYSARHPNSGKGITDYEEKTACLQYTYPPYTYL